MNFLCYLLADFEQRERERKDIWHLGIQSELLTVTNRKNRKESRKGGQNCALSIVSRVTGHLGMCVHMQNTQAFVGQTTYH